MTRFLLEECDRLGVGSAKGRVAELRSLLRFLHLRGLTDSPLAATVPPVAGCRDTTLPKTLTAAPVTALLDSCDRGHPTGLRDFAILTMLARLSLRAAEIAGLELGEVDWRAGEIVVRGKGPPRRASAAAGRRRPGAGRVSPSSSGDRLSGGVRHLPRPAAAAAQQHGQPGGS